MTNAQVAANFVACPTTGCWLWTGAHQDKGYGIHVEWTREKPRKRITYFAHRTVLEMKLGRPIKPGHCACHTCDRPGCIRPEHLWEGTNSDNVRDKIAKGRGKGAWGDRNAGAKLTWDKVTEIRALLPTMTNRQLAEKFGMEYQAMRAIRTGSYWPEHRRPKPTPLQEAQAEIARLREALDAAESKLKALSHA